MTEHPEHPSSKLIDGGGAQKADAHAAESNTRCGGRLSGRLFYFWSLLVAGLLLLVFGIPVIIIALITQRSHWVYPIAAWGARMWLRLSGMKVKVMGRENLKSNRAYVLIANHRSYLDPSALLISLDRRLGFIAKRELLRVPVLGQAMGYVNVVAIDRSNSARAIETLRAATERIHSGVSFVVFAEGTRARADELLPFKKGGFYMAMEAGVAVAPVAIKNTDKLMGKGTNEARPGTIEIVILPPIETRELSGDEDLKLLIAKVRESIAAELLPDGKADVDKERAGQAPLPNL
jgi:1-acyl-sn-glycerol-3-phosphate acyltransferase